MRTKKYEPAIIGIGAGSKVLAEVKRDLAKLGHKDDFGDEVMETIGKAVEILYNLDVKLSNQYIGKPCLHDLAINTVRESVRNSLKELESNKWIGSIKDLADNGASLAEFVNSKINRREPQ